MTFPKYIAAHASWWDRLMCRLAGHDRYRRAPGIWHPHDEAEDRRAWREWPKFCARCGKEWP